MKRTAAVIAALLIPILTLCACAAPAGSAHDPAAISVYYILPESAQVSGEVIASADVAPTPGGDPLSTAAEALAGFGVFPVGAGLLSFSLDDGELVLEMESGFEALSGLDRTAREYCAVYTFCALDGVESVTFSVGGAAVRRGLTPDDVVLAGSDSTTRLRLYFALEGSGLLYEETRQADAEAGIPLERSAIEALLLGPEDSRLHSPIPAEAQLLSVYTEDGLCTVSMSSEFFLGADPRLAVYSLVNTLTAISGIDRVRILDEGRTCVEYGGIPLTAPLPRNETMLGPAIRARGEREVLLCLLGRDGPALLPRLITADDGPEMYASLVLSLTSAVGEPGYDPLFSAEDNPVRVRVDDGRCTVIMPEYFLSSRTSGDADRAALAMAQTLSANGFRGRLDIYTHSGGQKTAFTEFDLS